MPLSVPEFLARFKKVKAYLGEHPSASQELKDAVAAAQTSFKGLYDPETLKAAAAAGDAVSSELEELLDSALILMNKDRLQSS